MTDDVAAIPITALGLPGRVTNAMRIIGVATVGDLVAYDRRTLLRVKNLGRLSVARIDAALATVGASLAPDGEGRDLPW